MAEKCFYLDVEATGLNEKKCGMYQIAIIIEIDRVVVEKFDIKINPGDVVVEDEAIPIMESAGVSLEDLMDYHPDKDAFTHVIRVLQKYIDPYNKTDKFFFIAYNAQFDEKYFRQWFKNHGNKFYGAYFWTPAICVMNLAAFTFSPIRPKLKNFQLATVCGMFDMAFTAHDALADIQATYDLFRHGIPNYLTLKLK